MTKDMEEAMLDLLCKKAMVGLTDEEQRELTRLEMNADGGLELQSLELTAAAMSMAGLEIEPMPAHLEASIILGAREHVAANAAAIENVFTAPRKPIVEETAGKSPIWGWLGWAVAGAACIALAFNIFSTRQSVQIAQEPTPTPTAAPLNSVQKREALLASASDIKRAEWGKGNVAEIADVSGDVVWSDIKQEGYMRFRGLPKNDPAKETYQLWIFEDGKLEPHPKDGGVFDVTADGEVIVPIDAKLAAKDPKVFAITIEKPGGVVVSKREKIAALAAPKTET